MIILQLLLAARLVGPVSDADFQKAQKICVAHEDTMYAGGMWACDLSSGQKCPDVPPRIFGGYPDGWQACWNIRNETIKRLYAQQDKLQQKQRFLDQKDQRFLCGLVSCSKRKYK